MFQRAGGGFGLIGLAALLQAEGLLDAPARRMSTTGKHALHPMAPRTPHFKARRSA